MECQPKTFFQGKMYPTKVSPQETASNKGKQQRSSKVGTESAPTSTARKTNQIETVGKQCTQHPRGNGRAISATVKRLFEKEVQKSYAELESELLTLRDDYAKLCSENQHINLEREDLRLENQNLKLEISNVKKAIHMHEQRTMWYDIQDERDLSPAVYYNDLRNIPAGRHFDDYPSSDLDYRTRVCDIQDERDLSPAAYCNDLWNLPAGRPFDVYSSSDFHYRKASARPKTQKQAWVVESLVDRSDRNSWGQVLNDYNHDSGWTEREADYLTEIDNLKAENQGLRFRYDELNQEKLQQQHNIEKYENYIMDFDEKERKLNRQIEKLEMNMTEMLYQKERAEKDLRKEIVKSKRQVDMDLLKERQKHERDLSVMKKQHEMEIKQLKEKEKEYENAIKVQSKENGRLEKECISLQQDLGKMKKDFEHKRNQYEEIYSKYSQLKKWPQAATKTNLLQNSDRKKKLADLEHEVEELRNNKNILHTQNQSLCRSLTKKDQELQRVNNEKEQLLQQVKDTDSVEVLNLQRELTNVTQELEKIRVDNSALHHEKQLLQNKIYQMEEEMKMDQENKSDEQKMALSQLQREVAALQREKSDLIKKAEQVKSNNESQLRQLREQIDKIKIESNGKDKLLKEKDNKLKEHERVQSGMTADAAEVNRKYESVMSKNKDLHGQVKELTSRCQKTADENVALRSKTEIGRSADRELSNLKQEIKDIQRQKTSVTLERDKLQSENKTLTEIFNNQKHQNQLLRKEVQAVKEEVERLDSDNKELQRQNQQLLLTKDSSTQEYQQTSAAAKAKIDSLQREISDLRKRTADSEERVTSTSKTIHELEWEKGTMEAKIKELNKQIQELNAREDSYTQKYQQMSSAAEETRNLQREITGLHKRIADSDGSSKSALEKMQREKEKLEAENWRQKEQIRNLNERQESQTKEYHGKDAAFAKEKEKLQREITTLRYHEKDSEITVKSALDRVQEVEGEKAQLKAEIQRQADQIQDLKIRHDTQRQEYQQVSAAAKDEKEKLEREITDLKKQRAGSDVISKSVTEKVQTAEREKTRLEADIQRYKDQIQELNTQNIQQVRREKQLKTDLDTQSKNYQEAQKELSGVKNELFGVKQQMEKERSSLQSQIERLTSSLAHNKDELDKAKQEKRSETKMREKGESELETFNRKYEIFLKKNRELEEQLKSLTESSDKEAKYLQQSLDEAKEELRRKEKVTDNLKNLLAGFESDGKIWEQENHTLQHEVQKLATENDNMKKRIRDLEKIEGENRNVHQQYTQQVEGHRHETQKLRQENKRLKAEVNDLQKRCAEAEQVWQDVQHAQKQNEENMEQYSSRKRELEDRLAALRMKLANTEKERDKYLEEKNTALTRLSALAGNRLRDNNPAIADLSDENRPISLGEKFNELYDNQWTDALEALEALNISEEDGIMRLYEIIKLIYEECRRLSKTQMDSLKKMMGLDDTDRDALKKLKDFRKSVAGQYKETIKEDVMSCAAMQQHREERTHCTSYINRCIELCWFMQVQDPPVVLDFRIQPGMEIDEKIYRFFTKTGRIVDFVVWPIMMLHEDGPLLQKGVVQPRK